MPAYGVCITGAIAFGPTYGKYSKFSAALDFGVKLKKNRVGNNKTNDFLNSLLKLIRNNTSKLDPGQKKHMSLRHLTSIPGSYEEINCGPCRDRTDDPQIKSSSQIDHSMSE
jgi:hypothetical protein